MTKVKASQRGLATDLGVHHNTVANYLDKPDLSDELLLKIGKVLRVDIAEHFPSMRRALPEHAAPALLQEPGMTYMTASTTAVPETLPACQLALMQLQAQHINLLTDFLNLVRRTQQHAQVA